MVFAHYTHHKEITCKVSYNLDHYLLQYCIFEDQNHTVYGRISSKLWVSYLKVHSCVWICILSWFLHRLEMRHYFRTIWDQKYVCMSNGFYFIKDYVTPTPCAIGMNKTSWFSPWDKFCMILSHSMGNGLTLIFG